MHLDHRSERVEGGTITSFLTLFVSAFAVAVAVSTATTSASHLHNTKQPARTIASKAFENGLTWSASMPCESASRHCVCRIVVWARPCAEGEGRRMGMERSRGGRVGISRGKERERMRGEEGRTHLARKRALRRYLVGRGKEHAQTGLWSAWSIAKAKKQTCKRENIHERVQTILCDGIHIHSPHPPAPAAFDTPAKPINGRLASLIDAIDRTGAETENSQVRTVGMSNRSPFACFRESFCFEFLG